MGGVTSLYTDLTFQVYLIRCCQSKVDVSYSNTFSLCIHFSYDMKRAINVRGSAIVHVAICPITIGAHMSILFIIKVKILVHVKVVIWVPPIMLIIKLRIVYIFWACNSNLVFKHVFLECVLRSTPNHTPLKYRCPDCCYVGFRNVNLKFALEYVLFKLYLKFQMTRSFLFFHVERVMQSTI